MQERFLRLLAISSLLSLASAQCYLEDANSDCALCWITSQDDGDTRLTECPPGISLSWQDPIPANASALRAYSVSYKLRVDFVKFPAVPKVPLYLPDPSLRRATAPPPSTGFVRPFTPQSSGAGPARRAGEETPALPVDVPQAYLRACITSRGACTPLVEDAAGLSLHTEGRSGDLDGGGEAVFRSELVLEREQWTIIAQVSYFTRDGEGRELRYDVAIGVARNVEEDPASVSVDTYVSTAVLGAVLCLLIGTVAWASRKGILDVDKILETLYCEEVQITADIICGIGDVAAYTVSVWTVILPDNLLIEALPAALMFLCFAWMGSLYNAWTGVVQLHALWQKYHYREAWRNKVSSQLAYSSVNRIRKTVSKSRRGSIVAADDAESQNVDEGSQRAIVEEQKLEKLQKRFELGRAGTVRANFAEHIVKETADEEKMSVLLDVELAYRELVRMHGSVVTIITESIPITAVQSYILLRAEGEVQIITVLTLIAATVVFGSKLGGLADYKTARIRRDKAEQDFFHHFCSGEENPRKSLQDALGNHRKSSQQGQLAPDPHFDAGCNNGSTSGRMSAAVRSHAPATCTRRGSRYVAVPGAVEVVRNTDEVVDVDDDVDRLISELEMQGDD